MSIIILINLMAFGDDGWRIPDFMLDPIKKDCGGDPFVYVPGQT